MPPLNRLCPILRLRSCEPNGVVDLDKALPASHDLVLARFDKENDRLMSAIYFDP